MKSLSRNLRRGVTLIELAVVMAVLGVLFVGIFSAYHTSLKISRASDPKHGTSRQNIFFALENIRSTFAQIYLIEGQRRLVFIGKNEGVQNQRLDRVVFAANHPNSEETGRPSVREVSFFLRPMKQNSEFYYLIRREDEMVDRDPESGGIEHILLDHVVSFQLKYSQRGDKWVDEWNSRDTKKIPKLIRIEIIALVGDTDMKYEALANPGMFYK
ncbi:MAG TPA: type II secretion system protein GspJ [Leptospiraceae bacterium]|nr:type II secretion system protein GspJ [Leptospiraceae bacterium]